MAEDRDPGEFVDGWAVSKPEDDWWRTGCPVCGHDELDVHLHGGVSCPACGWEGEQHGEHLLGTMPPDEETAKLWPDTVPWSEREQEYYRTAASRATVAEQALVALRERGGFTLALDGSQPRPGYYVAEDHTRVSPLRSVTALEIEKYMDVNAAAIRSNGGFFGGWATAHGDVYLETARSFDYLDEALERAAQNHEKAIWDGFLDREILVSDPNLE